MNLGDQLPDTFSSVREEVMPILRHTAAVATLAAAFAVVAFVLDGLVDLLPEYASSLRLAESIDVALLIALFALFALYTMSIIAIRLWRGVTAEFRRDTTTPPADTGQPR